MNDLVSIDSDHIKEIIATLPTKKRAIFSKALQAACEQLRSSRQNYDKAFDLAW